MNTERLLKLADFLETVPPEKLVMSHWQKDAPSRPEGAAEGGCGFAGCAIGWAAHAKLFDGLVLEPYISTRPEWMVPKYRGYSSFGAARELFDMDGDSLHEDEDGGPISNASWLFDDTSYEGNPTPAEVAGRIREFVSEASSSPSGARSA